MDENNEKEVEDGTKWTDCHMLKYGKLTVLELEIHKRGDFIQQIRARYLGAPLLSTN